MTLSPERGTHQVRSRVIWIAAILALSFIARAGTAQFVAEHLDDAGWFQFGSYKIFDERAQNIMDGVEPAFFFLTIRSEPTSSNIRRHFPYWSFSYIRSVAAGPLIV